MKLIPLTQGKFALVDDEDFDELSQHRWYAHGGGGTWYAERSIPNPNPSPHPNGRKTPQVVIGMHAIITGFAVTDHIDGNGLNNQRANLRDGRLCNNQNVRARRDGGSRYKGVGRARPGGWRVRIGSGGERCELGRYSTEEEAALVYDAAARERYGEYATYNFPRPGERSALTGEVVA